MQCKWGQKYKDPTKLDFYLCKTLLISHRRRVFHLFLWTSFDWFLERLLLSLRRPFSQCSKFKNDAITMRNFHTSKFRKIIYFYDNRCLLCYRSCFLIEEMRLSSRLVHLERKHDFAITGFSNTQPFYNSAMPGIDFSAHIVSKLEAAGQLARVSTWYPTES